MDEMSRVYVELDKKEDELRSLRHRIQQERTTNDLEKHALECWHAELERQRVELAEYQALLLQREQKLSSYFPTAEPTST